MFSPASSEQSASTVLARMASTDPLLPWIGAAVRDARQRAGRLQVHVAATRGVTEETVRKFEQGLRWPRDPDAMIAAYAEDLNTTTLELWTDAIVRWTQDTS